MKKYCEELKIDFGSGYNPNKEYKVCDITYAPNLDFVYDQNKNEIIGCTPNTVKEFYLRNVIHHIKDLEKTFKCLDKYLKENGTLKIIDVNENYYKQNVILDIIWYRYIIPRYEIWFSKYYRDYISILKSLKFKLVSYETIEEKEVTIWKKLSKN